MMASENVRGAMTAPYLESFAESSRTGVSGAATT